VAEETLTLLMRAHGSRTVSREVDRVGRAVRGLGDSMGIGTNKVGMYERAIRLLGTRLGMIILLAGLATITLGPPLIAVITLLTAALITLAGMAVPAILLVVGAMARFKAQADLAGSAANALKTRLASITASFKKAVGPGADIVMWNLANALKILQPLIQQMARPLTVFAQYLGQAMQEAAVGVAALGPEFTKMLISSAPLLLALGRMVAPFLGMLIDVATAGIPVLAQLLNWLTDFIIWLRPAIQDLIAFEQSAEGIGAAKTWLAGAAAAGIYLGSVLSALWQIVEQVYYTFRDWHWILVLIGGILVNFLRGLWILVHLFQSLPEPVRNTAVALGLLVAAISALSTAVALPIALIALIGYLTTLWHTSESFRQAIWSTRDALAGLWSILWNSPLFFFQQMLLLLIGLVIQVVGAFKRWHEVWWAIKQPILGVWSVLKTIIDALKWVVNNASQIGDVFNKIMPGGSKGVLSKQGLLGIPGVPILGDGGVVTRSGSAIVGERGAEVVHLPAGSSVVPGGGDGPIWIAATFVTPSGEVLAQQTLRASKKRKASR
jgi:hypothetical protein